MNHEALLAQLTTEHESLQFGGFSFADALAIGRDLVDRGLKEGLAVAIDISVNRQILFHASLPDSSPDNDQWVLRKNRVVERFFRSSLFIATQLRKQGKTIEQVYGLSSDEYAPYGGAVPIRIRGVGVVGTVTVSGLPDHEDHRMVVDALRRHLERA